MEGAGRHTEQPLLTLTSLWVLKVHVVGLHLYHLHLWVEPRSLCVINATLALKTDGYHHRNPEAAPSMRNLGDTSGVGMKLPRLDFSTSKLVKEVKCTVADCTGWI